MKGLSRGRLVHLESSLKSSLMNNRKKALINISATMDESLPESQLEIERANRVDLPTYLRMIIMQITFKTTMNKADTFKPMKE